MSRPILYIEDYDNVNVAFLSEHHAIMALPYWTGSAAGNAAAVQEALDLLESGTDIRTVLERFNPDYTAHKREIEDPEFERLFWSAFCNQWIVLGAIASPLGDTYLTDGQRRAP